MTFSRTPTTPSPEIEQDMLQRAPFAAIRAWWSQRKLLSAVRGGLERDGAGGTIYATGGAQAKLRARSTPRGRTDGGGKERVRLCRGASGGGDEEVELFGGGLRGGQAPEVDAQSAHGGDGELAAGRALDDAPDQFGHGRIGGLVAHQPPDQLDEQVAHEGIAVAVDVAVALRAAGLVTTGTQACVAGDLAAVLEAFPVADLAGQLHPGECADGLGQRLGGGGLEACARGLLLGIQRCDERAQNLQLGRQLV